jgi:hypothetical protein
MRSYIRTRAWSDAGRAEREAVEIATDAACQRIVDKLGDDLDELVAILARWGEVVRTSRLPGQRPARSRLGHRW